MLQAEQEDQQDAVERQQDRPARRLQGDEAAGNAERGQMAGKMEQALAVGPLQQAAPLFAAQPANDFAVVGRPLHRNFCVHRSLPRVTAGIERPPVLAA